MQELPATAFKNNLDILKQSVEKERNTLGEKLYNLLIQKLNIGEFSNIDDVEQFKKNILISEITQDIDENFKTCWDKLWNGTAITRLGKQKAFFSNSQVLYHIPSCIESLNKLLETLEEVQVKKIIASVGKYKNVQTVCEYIEKLSISLSDKNLSKRDSDYFSNELENSKTIQKDVKGGTQGAPKVYQTDTNQKIVLKTLDENCSLELMFAYKCLEYLGYGPKVDFVQFQGKWKMISEDLSSDQQKFIKLSKFEDGRNIEFLKRVENDYVQNRITKDLAFLGDIANILGFSDFNTGNFGIAYISKMQDAAILSLGAVVKIVDFDIYSAKELLHRKPESDNPYWQQVHESNTLQNFKELMIGKHDIKDVKTEDRKEMLAQLSKVVKFVHDHLKNLDIQIDDKNERLSKYAKMLKERVDNYQNEEKFQEYIKSQNEQKSEEQNKNWEGYINQGEQTQNIKQNKDTACCLIF